MHQIAICNKRNPNVIDFALGRNFWMYESDFFCVVLSNYF